MNSRPLVPTIAVALVVAACSSTTSSPVPSVVASAQPTPADTPTVAPATVQPTPAPTEAPRLATEFSEPILQAGSGTLLVSTTLTTAGGPVAGAPVSITTTAVGSRYAVIELTGTVPVSATEVIVGLRFNHEGAGPAPIDMKVYRITYSDGGSTRNKLRNSGFDRGFEAWGIWGTGYFRTPRSDRGDGRMLRLKATPGQTIGLNSVAVRAKPNTAFRLTVAAKLPPSGTLSGYAAAIFLYGSEINRQRLNLVAPAIPVASTATDATGVARYEHVLGPGTYIVAVRYSGGPGRLACSIERKITIR